MQNWDDIELATALYSVAGRDLGGIWVKSFAGTVRDHWQHSLAESLEGERAVHAVPVNISEQGLLGGLDFPATLKIGKPVYLKGLIANADGDVLLLKMAERQAEITISHLVQALDRGEIKSQSKAAAEPLHANISIVAFDESLEDEVGVGEALTDRLAFWIDLRDYGYRDIGDDLTQPNRFASAKTIFPEVEIEKAGCERLCITALTLGIDSLRALLFAHKVARYHAALFDRTVVSEEDLVAAVRLVLAPRATVIPMTDEQEEVDSDQSEHNDNEEPADPTPPEESSDDDSDLEDNNQDKQSADTMPQEVLLDAAIAAMPVGMLERLQAGRSKSSRGRQGKSGATSSGAGRGRAIGSYRGWPAGGAKLDVLGTLRAAVPWQKIRKQQTGNSRKRGHQVAIEKDDFRLVRLKQRSKTTTVFVVDASGSAAAARLAEAKGAVECMLADCYSRRDEVALIAFRGTGAELLLPPTRSLVRAKRSLTALPGGGGTPLAVAIDAAVLLALAEQRNGSTPSVVFLTDGKANITRQGEADRKTAFDEALQSAEHLVRHSIRCLVIDTAPRPHRNAELLAQKMQGIYLPLPVSNPAQLSNVVRATAG